MGADPLTPERGLYEPREPFATGMLDVGDGHRLYYEVSGNPEGKPAVFLHGGPGAGTSPAQRGFFDPDRYRIVLFDQRGCGRSTPHAAEAGVDMSANTTGHLVGDIERLREHLGVDRWLVFGGSWGSCLALAYAERHPDRVTELVLRGIFTLRRFELDWFYNGPGANLIVPELWERYREPLGDFDGDCIARYHELLFGDDRAAAVRAGQAWSCWESATTRLLLPEASEDDDFALAFARIENHYFVNGGFLREGQLIDEVDRIRHIPAVIVQGRYDLCCPARTAHDLHLAWPEADYRVVLAGHSAFEPMIASELVQATDRFAAA